MEQRTIKFKAKCLCDGEWVEGDLCRGLGGGLNILCFQEKEDGSLYFYGSHQINPSTVCQFTGLKDKNGKEIWEHDIVTLRCLGDTPCEVRYHRGCFKVFILDSCAELLELSSIPLQENGNLQSLKVIKPYTHVLFINGYGDDKPRVEKEIESITIGRPKKGWCPDEFLDKQYFVIKFK